MSYICKKAFQIIRENALEYRDFGNAKCGAKEKAPTFPIHCIAMPMLAGNSNSATPLKFPSKINQLRAIYIGERFRKRRPTCTRGRGGALQSILTSASCAGLGNCCCLVFLRRGFGRSAFAVVSYAFVVGSRQMLVLAGPRSRWCRLPLWSGRVRCWFWSARVAAVSFVSMMVDVWCFSYCSSAFGAGPSRRVRRFRFSALLVVCGTSRCALVLVVLRVRCFVSIFLCLAPSVSRPMPKLGNLRCKLIAFK